MPSFALITEGITDQVVIERILESHYRDAEDDELHVEYLQPIRDTTDRSRQSADDFGGWEQVLEHCSYPEHIVGALAVNDYLIIHVDADMCRHESINISNEMEVSEVCDFLVGLIKDRIGMPLLGEYGDRLIYAVPVYSTECWLISFYTNVEHEKSRVNNCRQHLNNLLSASRVRYDKNYRIYSEITRPLRRPRDLRAASAYSDSLAKFISDLPGID